MLRDRLLEFVKNAVDQLTEQGRLPEVVRDVPIEISDTKQSEHGDYACNLAMVASKRAGINPRQLGELLRDQLLTADIGGVFQAIDIAGPGFLNFRLQASTINGCVPAILAKGEDIAKKAVAQPQKINVEFVSVNPNGPITVGSGRGAAFGDTLSRVLQSVGHEVDREYYINDGVNSEQMRLFAESVKSYIENRPLPEKGYKGDYVKDVAESIATMAANKAAVNGFWARFTRETELDELSMNWDDSVNDAFTLTMVAKTQGRDEINATTLDELHHETALIDRSKYRHDSNLALVTVAANQLLEEGIDPLTIPFTEFTTRFFVALGANMAVLASYLKAFRVLGLEANVSTLSDPTFVKISEALQAEYTTNMTLLASNTKTKTQFESFRRALGTRAANSDLLASIASLPMGEPAKFVAEALTEMFPADDLLAPTSWYQQKSQELMIERQRQDLKIFGVEFKTWFSEQSLHDSGKVGQALEKLERAGNAYRSVLPRDAAEIAPDDGDEEGLALTGATSPTGEALWVASHTNEFGDDKDRVLIRADGRPAYIAADIAYIDNKLADRGYDKALLILGPDHHGYIGRMYAVYQALGFPMGDKGKPSRFEIIIFQIVRFVKDGKPAPMRKRDGNIYELRDLIDELGKAQAPNATAEEQRRIGADVARFFYLMRSHDTHMDFDIDLATKQSDENPVFYVQYAHARICSVLEKSMQAGLGANAALSELLVHPRELSLIKKILDLPNEVERCSRDFGVHRLTTYAVELARTYHGFYDACRVVQAAEPELSRARAALCGATRAALKSTLGLLGVSAPERMERAPLAE